MTTEAFFLHLGEHFIKTAGALDRAVTKYETVLDALVENPNTALIVENALQKAKFKVKQKAFNELLVSPIVGEEEEVPAAPLGTPSPPILST